MANNNISKITLPDGTTFNIEDSSIHDWARAATKPSYTATQVGAAAASHAHGNITNAGDITTSSTIASGDRLVINDQSASKVTNSSIVFGNSSTQYLANDGTWQNVPSGGSSYVEGNGIDITNDVISVESNLTVSGDTAYLQYATTPNVIFRTEEIQLAGQVTVGYNSYYTGDPLSIERGTIVATGHLVTDEIDLTQWVPIGITGYQFPNTTYLSVNGIYLITYNGQACVMPRIRHIGPSNQNILTSAVIVQILFISAGFLYNNI